MSKNTTPYCLMPWIHFHLTSKGQVNACCVSNIKYGNINNNTIQQIWNNDSINKIRNQFINQKFDNRCKVCFNREQAGAKSLRQETFEKYPNISIKKIQSPIYFDIRFSNICNFKCRTCWHGASSKWYNDAVKLKTNIAKQAIINNISDLNKFINQNKAILLNVKEFYFAGGEPLVTEAHYKLLDFLIDHKITNIKLRYNTNFSVLKFKNYNIINYWKHFKSVEVLASIDESEQLGEYIRKELNWHQFIKNREIIRTLSNVTFKISPTVSVFNIATLPAFYKKCISLNLISKSDIYINLLDRPYHYNCKVLSTENKINITKTYTQFFNWCQINQVPKSVQNQFKDCISFMNSENYHNKYWSVFIKETNKLDEIRQENLQHVFSLH